MKNIYCHKCGTIVGQADGGLKIRKGTMHTCGKCQNSGDIPEFMREIFGGKR